MKVKLTETQLKNVIRKSINEIFDNDFNGFHMGNQAGLANRAKNSLKAKLDPEYRKRKERQEDMFIDRFNRLKGARDIQDPRWISDMESGYHYGQKGKNLGTHYEEMYGDREPGYWNNHTTDEIENWDAQDFANNEKETEDRLDDYDLVNNWGVEQINESRLRKIIQNAIYKVL